MFIEDSVDWELLALEFIRRYEITSEFDMEVLDGLLREASSILYDPLLIHRLQDINNVSRWKHSIESKLEEGVLEGTFDE